MAPALPIFYYILREGAGFLFDTPKPSNLTLNLLLVGTPSTFGDINCGVLSSAPGFNGDTLGCIATAVAWLTYSMYVHGGPSTTNPIRSLPNSDYHFKTHSDWEPTENCTTRCMLVAGTPKNTWTSVGGGTYNGIYHELHFVHTDSMFGHRVYQGVQPGNSTLAARQYKYTSNQLGWNLRPIVIDVYAYKHDDLYANSFDAYQEAALGVSDWMGQSVEETVAATNFSGYCFEFSKDGQVVSSTLLGISQTSPTWESTFDADKDLSTCQNDAASSGAQTGEVLMVCGQNLTWIDPELLDDPDGNLTPNLWARNLVKRVGPSQGYHVVNYLDPRGVNLTWESAPYTNGRNGLTLQLSGGDDHVYALSNPGDCTDASLRSDAPISGPGAIQVDAEHIIERVTAPYFFEFIQNPELDLDDGNGFTRAPANLAAIPFNVVRDYMAIPYGEWAGSDIQSNASLFTDVADALGSTANNGVMTNLQRDMNNVKSRVWDTYVDVSSNRTFNPLANNPTVANTERALELLRGGVFVFNYLNDANVQRLLGQVHSGISRRTQEFDNNFNRIVTSQPNTQLNGLWVTFINFWAQRMANRHRNYANMRIAQLEAGWNRLLAGNPSIVQRAVARLMLAKIQALSNQIPGLIINRATLV